MLYDQSLCAGRSNSFALSLNSTVILHRWEMLLGKRKCKPRHLYESCTMGGDRGCQTPFCSLRVILAFTLFLDVQINLTMSGLVEINYSNQMHAVARAREHTQVLLTETFGVPVNSINRCSHTVTTNLNLNQFSRTNTPSPPTRVANPSFCRHLKNSLNTKSPLLTLPPRPQVGLLPVLANVM